MTQIDTTSINLITLGMIGSIHGIFTGFISEKRNRSNDMGSVLNMILFCPNYKSTNTLALCHHFTLGINFSHSRLEHIFCKVEFPLFSNGTHILSSRISIIF